MFTYIIFISPLSPIETIFLFGVHELFLNDNPNRKKIDNEKLRIIIVR